MNLNKITSEICKAFLQKSDICVGEYGDCVAVFPDGYRAYFIPKEQFPFDVEKLTNKRIDVQRFIPKNTRDATLTNKMQVLEKHTIQALTDGDVEVWVDVKFLKDFIGKSTRYEISTPTTPVLVYEDEKLTGMICPVRVQKD